MPQKTAWVFAVSVVEQRRFGQRGRCSPVSYSCSKIHPQMPPQIPRAAPVPSLRRSAFPLL